MDVAGVLKRYAAAVDEFLHAEVAPLLHACAVRRVADAMLYSLLAGGKRLRPVLCLLCAGVELPDNGGLTRKQKGAFFAAVSLEAVHTYSLIHDDLPAMDDARLRRGRPANHVEFSEWLAILAGDALNTFAFELLRRSVADGEEGLGARVEILGRAAGPGGIICGQALDLMAEKSPAELPEFGSQTSLLREIHLRKTAALFRGSCELGACIGGAPHGEAYARWGENLGFLFQVVDDLLDATGDDEQLGKTAGLDASAGKLTYVSLFGLERSRELCAELAAGLAAEARELVPAPGADGDFRALLSALPEYFKGRSC